MDTDDVNAYARPGGLVYVTSGMLDYVQSDDQLAGVIGHEIAHVALRHGAQEIEVIAAIKAATESVATSGIDLERIYDDQQVQIAIELVARLGFTRSIAQSARLSQRAVHHGVVGGVLAAGGPYTK